MAANGKLIEESMRPGDSPPEAAGLEIKTFGLLPILRRLNQIRSEGVSGGVSAEGLEKLNVNVSGRTWTVYVDSERLIRRLVFEESAIEYDDYRTIDGIRLPFRQRFFNKGHLYYELSFTTIDLKPAFSSDYFSHKAMLNEIVR
jgi:hypothetical protein